jgi:poly-gamma-glutamate synthesis protein (capsule biosynthesis protein)
LGRGIKRKTRKTSDGPGKKYIDSGADIVIGSHPHVLQGFEFYKGKLIVYSLGNFIFTNIKKDTMIINIEYTDNSYKARVIPCRIVNYRPVPINNETEKTAFYNKLESLSFNVDINDNGEILPKP